MVIVMLILVFWGLLLHWRTRLRLQQEMLELEAAVARKSQAGIESEPQYRWDSRPSSTVPDESLVQEEMREMEWQRAMGPAPYGNGPISQDSSVYGYRSDTESSSSIRSSSRGWSSRCRSELGEGDKEVLLETPTNVGPDSKVE